MPERAALAERVRTLMADRKDIYLRKPVELVGEDDRLGDDLGMDSVGSSSFAWPPRGNWASCSMRRASGLRHASARCSICSRALGVRGPGKSGPLEGNKDKWISGLRAERL